MDESVPDLPKGLVSDRNLPEAVNDVTEAQTYVGRKVCKCFPGKDGYSVRWFLGIIKSVEFDDDAIYFKIQYEDGDEEEFLWEDIRQWAVIDVNGTFWPQGQRLQPDCEPPEPLPDPARDPKDPPSDQEQEPLVGLEPDPMPAPEPDPPGGSKQEPIPERPQDPPGAGVGPHSGARDPHGGAGPFGSALQPRLVPDGAGGSGGAAGPPVGPPAAQSEGHRTGGHKRQREQSGTDEAPAPDPHDQDGGTVRRRLEPQFNANGAAAEQPAGPPPHNHHAPHRHPGDGPTAAANGGAPLQGRAGGAPPHTPQPLPQPPAPPPPQAGPQVLPAPPRTLAPIRRTLGGSQCWPAGHLHRIQCANFMCHLNFVLEFGKHVTFVSGRNGSGKSATLQGLQACLGTAARDTGRGSSLGDWVHTERRVATVTLDIWNSTDAECGAGQKFGPFKHELYGSMIRIVRRIVAQDKRHPTDSRRPGTATYQLFRADGREVKRTEMGGRTVAQEVAALAEHFNIDGSNPLIVITQEKVKSFHDPGRAGAPCKKYEVYMEGTCLAALRDKLAEAGANLARTTANLQARREDLERSKKELRALERRVQELRQTDELRRLVSDLECAVVWTVVDEVRGELARFKQQTDQLPQRVAEQEAQLAAEQRAVAELQAQEQRLRDSLEQTRVNPTQRVDEAKGRREAAQRRQRELTRRKGKLADEIGEHDVTVSGLEEELQEQRGKAAVGRVRQYQEQLTAKQAELQQIKAQKDELGAQRTALLTRKPQLAAAQQEAREGRDAAHAAVQDARRYLRDLEAEGGAAGGAAQNAQLLARRWGGKTMQLVNAVRSAPPRTFSRPPIGPVGMFLKRVAGVDPGLHNAIEVALGSVMETWIVAAREDAYTLRDIAHRMRIDRVTVSQDPYENRVHNYGTDPVVDEQGVVCPRLIDLVELVEGLDPTTHATIVNHLLDSGNAAVTAVVNTRELGQQIAKQRIPALAKRSLGRAYDRDGTRYENRNGTMITTPGYRARLRLATDNRGQLAEARAELAARESALSVAEAAVASADAEMEGLERALRPLVQQLSRLAGKEHTCQAELSRLLSEAPEANVEAASEEILNRLRATQASIATLKTQIAGIDSELNNVRQSATQATRDLEEAQQQLRQYGQRRQELMEDLEDVGNRRAEAAGVVADRERQLAEAREAVRQGQAVIAQYEKRIHECLDAANGVCPREEGLAAIDRVRHVQAADLATRYPDRTEEARERLVLLALKPQAMQHQIQVTQNRISRVETEAGGDLEQLELRTQSKGREVAALLTAVEAVTKKVTIMQEAQVLRTTKHVTLRNQMDRLSNAKFSHYMARRNFVAHLRVDHSAPSLDLVVRKTADTEAATSLMQLSGGERSFTTACFLLAMGEVLSTPFHAMDEYDVYMDTDRRKMATMALLEFAWRCNPHSQLILLSPQDTAILTESFNELVKACTKDKEGPPPANFMKIIRLEDPRANGGVAGPGA